MADVVNLGEHRQVVRKREADLKQDGTLWTVEDMLVDALAEARTGPRTITKGVFVYLYDKPDGTQGVGWAQANMTRAEQVGFLALAVQQSIDDWRV